MNSLTTDSSPRDDEDIAADSSGWTFVFVVAVVGMLGVAKMECVADVVHVCSSGGYGETY